MIYEPETIDWLNIAKIMNPRVRLHINGTWWLEYRSATTRHWQPADYEIELLAQNEDDAMQEASNRLMIPVEHIRRFGE